MHILITNDDGPPSPTSSPYILPFISALRASPAHHTLTIILPHAQRSWISKAHIVGAAITPTYYRPATHTTHALPSPDPAVDEWILIDSTPASCVQLGLYHSFPCLATSPSSLPPSSPASVPLSQTPSAQAREQARSRPPIDLVLSGPNHGRNTTAVFALSSGTLGGALEAALCGVRGIALSFAFFKTERSERSERNELNEPSEGTELKEEDQRREETKLKEEKERKLVEEASRHSVRVIEHLAANWGKDVEWYSVNVPLVEGVGGRKVLWAGVLGNRWGRGCFEEVEGGQTDPDVDGEGEDVDGEKERDGNEGEDGAKLKKVEGGQRYRRRQFRWAPRFADVYESVERSAPGNDGWAIKEGFTSVTPLKANFMHAAPCEGEIKL